MLRYPEYPTEPGLTDEHCESLRNVDLRLSFGIHGWQTAVEKHGFAVLAIYDPDFDHAEQFVSRLNAARGDVFAQEGSSFPGAWSARRVLSGYADMLEDSPYVDDDDLILLSNLRDSDPSEAVEHIARESPAVTELWEKLRDFRLTTPIEYAAAKAACKGVEVHYADASVEESSAAEKAFYKRLMASKPLMQLALGLREEAAIIRFRDHRTVLRLGAIAATMETGSAGVPILGYMGGGAHRKGIERVLRSHDIPFISETYSPDRNRRHWGQNIRTLGYMVTGGQRTGIVNEAGAHYDKLWIANAQQHSKDPRYKLRRKGDL